MATGKMELGDHLRIDFKSASLVELVEYYRTSKRPGDDEVMKMPIDAHCAQVIYNLIQTAVAVEKDLWIRVKEQIDTIYFG